MPFAWENVEQQRPALSSSDNHPVTSRRGDDLIGEAILVGQTCPKFALTPARISPRHGPGRSTVRPLPGSTEHERANSTRVGRMARDPRSTSLVPPIAAGIAAVPKASGVCQLRTRALLNLVGAQAEPWFRTRPLGQYSLSAPTAHWASAGTRSCQWVIKGIKRQFRREGSNSLRFSSRKHGG
jgi:hypothetical protein